MAKIKDWDTNTGKAIEQLEILHVSDEISAWLILPAFPFDNHKICFLNIRKLFGNKHWS